MPTCSELKPTSIFIYAFCKLLLSCGQDSTTSISHMTRDRGLSMQSILSKLNEEMSACVDRLETPAKMVPSIHVIFDEKRAEKIQSSFWFTVRGEIVKRVSEKTCMVKPKSLTIKRIFGKQISFSENMLVKCRPKRKEAQQTKESIISQVQK